MKLRVTKTSTSLSVTSSWPLNAPRTTEVVEGTLVMWRQPGVDRRPRHSAALSDVEATIRAGARKLAILHIGSDGKQHLWATSTVRVVDPNKNGFKVVTENSEYSVEILAEGQSPRRARRDTGSFPIYDPTPVPDAG